MGWRFNTLIFLCAGWFWEPFSFVEHEDGMSIGNTTLKHLPFTTFLHHSQLSLTNNIFVWFKLTELPGRWAAFIRFMMDLDHFFHQQFNCYDYSSL